MAQTYTDGRDKSLNAVTSRTPELFDNYREGQAWNVGLGYEIGPYQTALSYFESKASRTDNRDKVIVFPISISLMNIWMYILPRPMLTLREKQRY